VELRSSGEEKNYSLSRESKPGRPTCSLFTKLTKLLRLFPSRRTCEDNIKMHLKEIGRKVEKIHLQTLLKIFRNFHEL